MPLICARYSLDKYNANPYYVGEKEAPEMCVLGGRGAGIGSKCRTLHPSLWGSIPHRSTTHYTKAAQNVIEVSRLKQDSQPDGSD